jgi:predicted metal-dependent enzyme (double-stranded beta helix superfamily)
VDTEVTIAVGFQPANIPPVLTEGRMAMFDLDTFVTDCRAALKEPTPEIAVRELIERTVAQPGDVERALGTPTWGGITVLHQSPELTILNVVWAPGMAVYPHDHRMWAVIGLYGGREDNTFYRRSPEGLIAAGGKVLEMRDATLLGRNVVHKVTNPLRVFTGAIHVYGGDFFTVPRSEWTPDTLEERPYDAEGIRRVFAEAYERWRAECATGRAIRG